MEVDVVELHVFHLLDPRQQVVNIHLGIQNKCSTEDLARLSFLNVNKRFAFLREGRNCVRTVDFLKIKPI